MNRPTGAERPRTRGCIFGAVLGGAGRPGQDSRRWYVGIVVSVGNRSTRTMNRPAVGAEKAENVRAVFSVRCGKQQAVGCPTPAVAGVDVGGPSVADGLH